MDSNFFQSVYEIVKLIPQGRITTYGAIANALGTKKSARMVGWALNASNAQKLNLPAHRVVNRNGLLSGKHHFDTPSTMQLLLESEGIQIKKHQIQDFTKYFWDPIKEIEIK